MGHLTRLLSIARKMVEKDESINPIFITTSEACEVLYKHNIMYYKLPSKSYLKLNNKIRRRDLQMMYNTTVMNLLNYHKLKFVGSNGTFLPMKILLLSFFSEEIILPLTVVFSLEFIDTNHSNFRGNVKFQVSLKQVIKNMIKDDKNLTNKYKCIIIQI